MLQMRELEEKFNNYTANNKNFDIQNYIDANAVMPASSGANNTAVVTSTTTRNKAHKSSSNGNGPTLNSIKGNSILNKISTQIKSIPGKLHLVMWILRVFPCL